MISRSGIKKVTTGVFYSLFLFFSFVSFSLAQNSPLAVRGEQANFGNLKFVSQFGHILFADQPDKETVAMLKDHGISLVINIRGINENEGYDERKAVEAQGIAYIQIPYMNGRYVNGDALDEIISLLKATAGNGTKILLHSTRSQRAGSVLGATLYRDYGYSKEEANQYAKQAGLTSGILTRIHNEFLDTFK